MLITVLYITIMIYIKAQVSEDSSAKGAEFVKGFITIVLGFAVCWLHLVISIFLLLFVNNVIRSYSFQYFLFVASFAPWILASILFLVEITVKDIFF